MLYHYECNKCGSEATRFHEGTAYCVDCYPRENAPQVCNWEESCNSWAVVEENFGWHLCNYHHDAYKKAKMQQCHWKRCDALATHDYQTIPYCAKHYQLTVEYWEQQVKKIEKIAKTICGCGQEVYEEGLCLDCWTTKEEKRVPVWKVIEAQGQTGKQDCHYCGIESGTEWKRIRQYVERDGTSNLLCSRGYWVCKDCKDQFC